MPAPSSVRQITSQPHGHIIANRNVWSPDGESILYDLREDETAFTGERIERVNVRSGDIEILYRSTDGACCGVPTCSPVDDRYVFIHGPERPTADWSYCAWHRRGVLGRLSQPGCVSNLDARDIVAPFTPGALRGGTHLHMFSPDGLMVASTYEDHVLATSNEKQADSNRRVVAISLLGHPVTVPKTNARNHDGQAFTIIATPVSESPRQGSDEIFRAHSEAWIDADRLACLGEIACENGHTCHEVFLISLPKNLWHASTHLAQASCNKRIATPLGIQLSRLTRTCDRKYPGITGPRHWTVASPSGAHVGCFAKDDDGHAQFHIIEMTSGNMHQVSRHPFSATSAFTWRTDGQAVAYVADGSVIELSIATGEYIRLTPNDDIGLRPTHHACVYSPDGAMIAFMSPGHATQKTFNQLFVVETLMR